MVDHVNETFLFQPSPQSVRRLVAAVLEPGVAVVALLIAAQRGAPTDARTLFIVSMFVLALGVPGRDRFSMPPLRAAGAILRSWLLTGTMLLFIGWALQGWEEIAPATLVAWFALTPCLQWLAVTSGRLLIARSTARASHAREVVVIGSGAWGLKVATTLGNRPDAQQRVLGFFDDRRGDRLDDDSRKRWLGTLKDAAAYVRKNRVAEVHITLPLHAHPRMHELIAQLQGTTASVFYVPDIMGIGVVQGRLEDRDGLPIIGLCETPFTGSNLLIKRISDIVIASLALVVLAPVLAAVAIGVRLSGPGPVIFRQRRNGLGGEEIVVYKFRSMNVLDDGAHVRQATRDDVRFTRFGKFIRRTSLDELPQFINVLQGRMSVVGPRPHAVAHNELYRDIVRSYMVRHKVRPGITGWAQVTGHRGETDTLEKMQARVECDLEYLRHWSLAFDLRIIARTVRLVLFDRQAF